MIEENHNNEQYFFTSDFLTWLTDSVEDVYRDKKICCVCCPSVGIELASRGMDVTILDIDTRFSHHSQFKYYDITEPKYLDTTFDLIVCDPPFFNVSFGVLLHALKSLAHFDTSTEVMLSYLLRRESKFIQKFSEFGLHRMRTQPQYNTVDVKDPKRDIRLYTNVSQEQID